MSAECPRCGLPTERVECWDCSGEGYTHHDCGEDCCCCLDPEPNVTCGTCGGDGGWSECADCVPRTIAAQPKPRPRTRRNRETKASEVEPSPNVNSDRGGVHGGGGRE